MNLSKRKLIVISLLLIIQIVDCLDDNGKLLQEDKDQQNEIKSKLVENC